MGFRKAGELMKVTTTKDVPSTEKQEATLSIVSSWCSCSGDSECTAISNQRALCRDRCEVSREEQITSLSSFPAQEFPTWPSTSGVYSLITPCLDLKLQSLIPRVWVGRKPIRRAAALC